MAKEPVTHLLWRGLETVEEATGHLAQNTSIEIDLPASYNHTLFRTLRPDASSSALEHLDVTSGVELLDKIATIPGLEAFAALARSLTPARATVRVISPPKLIITLKQTRPGG